MDREWEKLTEILREKYPHWSERAINKHAALLTEFAKENRIKALNKPVYSENELQLILAQKDKEFAEELEKLDLLYGEVDFICPKCRTIQIPEKSFDITCKECGGVLETKDMWNIRIVQELIQKYKESKGD